MNKASTIPAEIDLRDQLDTSGIARRVTRRFLKQYFFVGHFGQTVSLPVFEVDVLTKIQGFARVPQDVKTRTIELTLKELIAKEDEWFLKIVHASGEHADAGATTGLGTLKIEEAPGQTLFHQLTAPMIERGVLVKHIFFNVLDYVTFVRKPNFSWEFYKAIEPEEGLSMVTERAVLETGHLANYNGAAIYQSRNVPRGTVYIFGSRTDEQIAKEPNTFDLVMNVDEPPVMTFEEVDRHVEIKIVEKIGIGVGGNFAQIAFLPSAPPLV